MPQMMRRTASILLAICLLFWGWRAEAFDLARHVQEFRLANGMRWLVVRRTQAPVFSGIVMVRAGGADETPGKTGLAHLFEHMAFKGSSRLGTKDWAQEEPILARIEDVGAKLTEAERTQPKDPARIAALSQELAALQRGADRVQMKNEVWELLMRNGAHELNAYTSKDLTAFYANMPATRLPLWAEVTAELIFAPAFREFYTERSVVAEERRTSVENDPEGALGDRLLATAYLRGPYSFPTTGSARDAEGLTIADARAFHAKHYVASNMVGVIVGDVTLSEVRRVVTQAFGAYPKRPVPEAPGSGGDAARGVTATLRFNAAPSVAVAFHKSTLPNKDEYTFDVIQALLCEGSSSRLERRLVYDERLAKDVYCSDGYPGSRLDNLFVIWVEPLKGKSLAAVRRAIDDELARLRREQVREEELARARKLFTASIVYALDDNQELAESLAHFATIFGDWRILADYPARIAAVGASDVQQVAERSFVDADRIVVERVHSK
jgi:predicted Zn-dependent peptidase